MTLKFTQRWKMSYFEIMMVYCMYLVYEYHEKNKNNNKNNLKVVSLSGHYASQSSMFTPDASHFVEEERIFCACAPTLLPFRHPDRERRDGPSAALLESSEKIRPGIPILVSCASVACLPGWVRGARELGSLRPSCVCYFLRNVKHMRTNMAAAGLLLARVRLADLVRCGKR